MKLFFRETGAGDPLVILHGLYGSSDNWMTVARQLGQYYHLFLPDLRNHGRSPHDTVHDYPSMVADLEEFVHDQGFDRFSLMGHSMGGKTAMYYALQHPGKINALISVDISPRTYRMEDKSGTSFGMHKKMMEAMLRLDLPAMRTRNEIMEALAGAIPSERVRQFLLKNLTRDEQNRFRWKINLPVLYNNLHNILAGPDSDPALKDKRFDTAPVLFLRGGNSNYITEEDIPLIHRFFPQAEIYTVPGAGHWLHAEQPEHLIRKVIDFLNAARSPK